MSNGMDFLEGAVDLHVHSAPDIDCRRFDDIDLAREAARAGMGALLIKSHQNSTVERAYLVSKVVTEIKVFGGLVLNETVGGINSAAVELALRLGAKQIWMPTRSALNHRRVHNEPNGISILDSAGRLVPEVEEILQLVATSNCILGTGHLSPEETLILVSRAREIGIRKTLITHPEWGTTFYSSQLQRQLAAGGGIAFERCFVSTIHGCGRVPFSSVANSIADVGVETTILSTDLGQADTPPPVEGLKAYAERLLSFGFSPDDLRQMMQVNPWRLLST